MSSAGQEMQLIPSLQVLFIPARHPYILSRSLAEMAERNLSDFLIILFFSSSGHSSCVMRAN